MEHQLLSTYIVKIIILLHNKKELEAKINREGKKLIKI